MPVISDARRAERRTQILNAAWICFQKQGLHATTMDDIIRGSGLSAGAVYSYFRSKEELIRTAVGTSLLGLQELLQPILQREPLPPPGDFVREITTAIDGFSARDGFDLKRIALLGWAEAQRNADLRALMRGFYVAFRDRLAEAAANWRRLGVIDATTEPDDAAKALLALIVGFVVEAAIIGDVEPAAIGRGLRGLRAGPTKKGAARRRSLP